MALSGEEQRRWRELARQLRHDRRLAAQAARFGAVIRWRHDLAAARTGAAIPAVTWLPAMAGACLGLALIVAGGLAHSSGLTVAGTGVLVVILMLGGMALIAIGTAGCRHLRSRDGQP